MSLHESEHVRALMRAGCFAGFSLAAIWTSFVQSKGTAQGAFFDPIT
jgi:hypothetical protein